jgi:hypothetical protein
LAHSACGAPAQRGFVLSAVAPEVEFAWDRVAPADTGRFTLAVDLDEVRNLAAGFVTIQATLACPGKTAMWTTTFAPHPPTQRGRFLLAIPRAARPACAARLALKLDASMARSVAPDQPIEVRGALAEQRIAK